MAATNKHTIFEDTVRLMIATGSGLSPSLVVPAFDNSTAPESGLFASVTLINQTTEGLSAHDQYRGETESFVVDRVVVRTMWQVDWFRQGAMYAAFDCRDWLRSESGKSWAATANVDGRIRFINVYERGTGYQPNTIITLRHPPNEDGLPATGVCETNADGGVVLVRMTHFGTGFRDIPDTAIDPANNPDDYSYYEFSPTSGTGATFGAAGFGMVVEGLGRMEIKNLSQIVGADYEERACLTLTTCHQYLRKDDTSGRIERIYGDTGSFDLFAN